ncbi:TonB-dependent receptor, partial [bacterium]|nr:TonB-dependent receptor [bacterium]
YLMEFRNELIKTGTIGEFGSDNLINAKKSRHSGFELSGNFLVLAGSDKFYLRGNLNLSKNRVLKFSDQTDVNGNRVYPKSWENNPIPSSPELLANFGFAFERNDFAFDLDGKFVGKQFLDSSKNDQTSVGSYFVLNSTLNYTFFKKMSLKLAVNNVLDKKYETGGYVDWDGARLFPAAERNYFLGVDFSL